MGSYHYFYYTLKEIYSSQKHYEERRTSYSAGGQRVGFT